MAALKSKALLKKLSRLNQKQKQSFSKDEILKKVNEIKYLSSQKRVPKISLRKEILHLEHLLQGIFQLDEKLRKHDKEESAKIKALKKQVETLRQKVVASDDNDLHKKVEHLSHVLGDYLAKSGSQRDIEFSKRLASIKERKVFRGSTDPGKSSIPSQTAPVQTIPPAQQPTQPVQAAQPTVPRPIRPISSTRMSTLQHRLSALKQELEIKKQVDGSSEQIQKLEQAIALIEEKLRKYQSSGPKHTMMIQPHAKAQTQQQSAPQAKAATQPHTPPPQPKYE